MYFFSFEHQLRNVLVADLPSGMTVNKGIETLKGFTNPDLAQLLILRPSVTQPIFDIKAFVVEQEAIFPALRIPLMILYSEKYKHQISEEYQSYRVEKGKKDFLPPSIKLSPTDQKKLLVGIQAAEMDSLVTKGSANFPKIGNFAYQTPSGKLVESFLRAGNIQTSRAALDGIFFWLLPELHKTDAILVDTWSIGSTALNTARRLGAYRGENPPPVEFLSGYFAEEADRVRDLATRVDRLKTEVAENNKDGQRFHLTVILSAFSSGRLFDIMNSEFTKRTQETKGGTWNTVSLFNLLPHKSSPFTLADYSQRPEYGLVTNPDAIPIKIDPRALFILRQIDHVVEIDNPRREGSGFTPFDLPVKERNGLVRVHKDHPAANEDSRHHGIWIDTTKLVGDPDFQAKMVVALDRQNAEWNKDHPTPTAIAAVDHYAGRIMAKIAQEKYGIGADKVLYHPDLNPRTPTDEEIPESFRKLSKDDRLLILDDAFITSARLNNFQMGLRYLVDPEGFEGKAHYFTALSRPTGPDVWTEMTRRMWRSRGNGYLASCVTQVILPDWREEKCPWCVEERHLKRIISTIKDKSVRDRLRDRKRLLSHKDGLSDNELFLGASKENLSWVRKLWYRKRISSRLGFGPTSVFGNKPDDDGWIFASVASFIEQKRQHMGKKGRQEYALSLPQGPLHTVLNHGEYLVRKYTDSLLRASILRAALPHELQYTDAAVEKARNDEAKRLMQMPVLPHGDIGPEIYIAAMSGKFPQLWDKEQAALLSMLEEKLPDTPER